MTIFDGVVLALVAICILVWPTQLISDSVNRWLRIATIVALAAHVLLAGPSIAFVPTYCVGILFALLLVRDRKVNDEPSAVRESREGAGKTGARWILIGGCAAALAATLVLTFL